VKLSRTDKVYEVCRRLRQSANLVEHGIHKQNGSIACAISRRSSRSSSPIVALASIGYLHGQDEAASSIAIDVLFIVTTRQNRSRVLRANLLVARTHTGYFQAVRLNQAELRSLRFLCLEHLLPQRKAERWLWRMLRLGTQCATMTLPQRARDSLSVAGESWYGL
jgi:hypothetical protein